jgi:hypothetical protein
MAAALPITPAGLTSLHALRSKLEHDLVRAVAVRQSDRVPWRLDAAPPAERHQAPRAVAAAAIVVLQGQL